MSYRTQETGQEVVLAPAGKPLACVIWLHGLGADGHDFVPIVPEIFWNSCARVSVPCGSFHVPATFAGTTQNSALHQLVQSSLTSTS